MLTNCGHGCSSLNPAFILVLFILLAIIFGFCMGPMGW